MKEDNLIPIHLLGSFEVISKSEKRRRIIAGFASVIELDKQDHLITKDALESGVETLLKNSEYANLMLVHRNIQIGKVIDKYNKLTTHVNDEGLFIVAEIRSDLDAANEVWESILSGDYNGFSIAAEVLKSHGECDDEKCWKVIEKMNIFEISVCNKPVNSKSGFVVISKGEDLPDNVIENVYKHVGNNMTKKKTSPSEETEENVSKEEIIKEEITKDEPEVPEAPKQEETTEKSEFNIEAAIEEIKRQVAALTGIITEMNKAEEEEDEDMEDDEEDKEAKKADDECKDCDPEIKSEDDISEKIDDLVSLSDYNSFLMSYFESEKEGSIESAIEVWSKRDEKTSDEILEDIKKSVESVISRLDKEDKIIELNSAIKARDDKISELETKLNVIEKADDEKEAPKVEQKEEKPKEEPIEKAEKEEPKTLVNEESKEILFDSPIIIKNGTVSANK